MNNYHKSTLLILFLVLIILSPSNPTPLTTSSYWSIIKDALHTFFFPPPNLDFRAGGGSSSDATATTSSSSSSEGGRRSGVKHAATMSLDKTKATVEESAKSAANLAKEAAQKLHNTFESPHHSRPDL